LKPCDQCFQRFDVRTALIELTLANESVGSEQLLRIVWRDRIYHLYFRPDAAHRFGAP
jgi:hypothetical protein